MDDAAVSIQSFGQEQKLSPTNTNQQNQACVLKNTFEEQRNIQPTAALIPYMAVGLHAAANDTSLR